MTRTSSSKRRRWGGRSFRLTREGKAFVAVTLGVGTAAINTGNNMLYLVLALMLSLLLTSGVLSDLVLYRLRVHRLRLPRLYAAGEALIELELRNEKRRFPSLSIELVDVASDGSRSATGWMLRVGPEESARVLVGIMPSRRGAFRFGYVEARTRYPFGLIEKCQRFEAPADAVVYPRVVPVELPALLDVRVGHEQSAVRRGAWGDVIGLRDIRPGDPLRDVHARRSASMGRLIVRERGPERGSWLRVRLDRRLDDTAFEAAVSHAASTAVAAIAHGRAVAIVTDDGSEIARAIGPRDLDAVLSTLAFVDRNDVHADEAAE